MSGSARPNRNWCREYLYFLGTNRMPLAILCKNAYGRLFIKTVEGKRGVGRMRPTITGEDGTCMIHGCVSKAVRAVVTLGTKQPFGYCPPHAEARLKYDPHLYSEVPFCPGDHVPDSESEVWD